MALVVALAGCGSGEVTPPAPQVTGSDPVAWVGAFCGGLDKVLAGVALLAKSQPTPQGQKDGLLEFSDSAQRAFATTAQQLGQVGQPRITDGKRVHDAAVDFFTKTAGTIGEQRAKLAGLDANAPDFLEKAGQLQGPDLGAATTQVQELTSNAELAPAFGTAPECQRLRTPATPR
ncbi:MAG: hypothetical protein ACRDRP_04485 [Pseudonocardiaceae bacterium]